MSSFLTWGDSSENQGPLARFLPPLPYGLAKSILDSQEFNLHPDNWILDPFGASPSLSVDLAHSGYKVLVTANNPVMRFLLEMAANPPPESEFRAALAELASAKKGEERIEAHLSALYTTDCARCGRSIMADAFIWEKGAPSPYARIYSCQHCGDDGEHPTTSADVEHATIAIAGLYRMRAIERVASLNDPDRSNAEEAIAVYPPRAVYALFTLINKLDGLSLSPIRRRCIEAMLLTACDQANTLWAYPVSRERPRQLGIPPRYRENNVWLSLENSISTWINPRTKIPVAIWPHELASDASSGGGILIFEGRLRDLAADLANYSVSAIIAALPRPNQAFWTLSALWAGWLWGRDAVGPFKSVLRRRRYDWAWHTTALASAMKILSEKTPSTVQIYGLVGEVEPGFLKAALVATDLAGFDISEMTLRDNNSPACLKWQHGSNIYDQPSSDIISSQIQSATTEYLMRRGEPADYLHLSAAAALFLSKSHAFRGLMNLSQPSDMAEENPANVFSQTQSAIRETLTFRGGFLRYGASDAPESGYWWLKDSHQSASPQADRIEMDIVRYLLHNPGTTIEQIDRHLRTIYTGLYTPTPELISTCLGSYGEQDPPESNNWVIRAIDAPDNRRVDIKTIHEQLSKLAIRLGFQTHGEAPIVWLDKSKQPQYWFYIKASAIFSDILLDSGLPANRTLIVLPGSRAGLVLYKLQHDPRLNQMIQTGWRFLKFRHLRWLLDTPILTLDGFDDQLNADPLSDTASQQRLF